MTVDNFAARLAQADLATKADIDDVVGNTDFDVKLKNKNKINKKVTPSKRKQLETENKRTDLTNKVARISEKNMTFCLREFILQVIMAIRDF